MSINFSWFPGHMQTALRSLSKEVKPASMVLMVLDARCPHSSRNPSLESLFSDKPIIYVLNKADLASVNITNRWAAHFESKKMPAIPISCKTNQGARKLLKSIKLEAGKFEKTRKAKRRATVFRIITVGIPNSGKSSLINLLSPQKTVKTGKKPGLTRGKQWLRIKPGIEILDSPGVMPPRMDDPDTGWILGSVGAIKTEIMPVEQVALKLIEFLKEKNLLPANLFGDEPIERPVDALKRIICSRGFIKKGGEPEWDKAAVQVLKLFREGKMGRISLESPFDIHEDVTENVRP